MYTQLGVITKGTVIEVSGHLTGSAILFGPRVYPLGSIVIALVRLSVCLSVRPSVRPSLNISETAH